MHTQRVAFSIKDISSLQFEIIIVSEREASGELYVHMYVQNICMYECMLSPIPCTICVFFGCV